MNCKVLLFARVREICGSSAITIPLPAHATVADLRRALATSFPDLKDLIAHCWFSINAQYASDEAPLNPQQEIACIPPVSGG